MITDDPRAFAAAWARLPADGPPAMRAALLVDPSGFAVSAQSATDNAYMEVGVPVDRDRAAAQLAAFAAALRRVGVPTLTLPGVPGLDDAVFPNNVYAFAPGRFVVGSMRHPVRRREAARADVRSLFVDVFGYALHDLSDGPVGELTGVLAVDRRRRAAVCGTSSRVDPDGVAPMHDALDLALTLATPLAAGEYHTNLVLAVLAGDAAVCWDAGFADPEVPRALAACWPGRILHLSHDEKMAFAGNCIAATPTDVFMSRTAERALCAASRAWFPRHGFTVHAIDVDELEKGGGSLRCLVAEVF